MHVAITQKKTIHGICICEKCVLLYGVADDSTKWNAAKWTVKMENANIKFNIVHLNAITFLVKFLT